MSVYHLSKRGRIKRVRQGVYGRGDLARGTPNESAAVLWAIKSHPGATLDELSEITGLFSKTIGKHAKTLIEQNKIYRDRNSSTKPYHYYHVTYKQEEVA